MTSNIWGLDCQLFDHAKTRIHGKGISIIGMKETRMTKILNSQNLLNQQQNLEICI